MNSLSRIVLQLLLSLLLIGALLPLAVAAMPPEQARAFGKVAPTATGLGLVLAFLFLRLIWPGKRPSQAEKDRPL
jgi:hypothetical protein